QDVAPGGRRSTCSSFRRSHVGGAMAALLQDGDEPRVEGGGSLAVVCGAPGQVVGPQENGTVLPAAEPSMGADQALECRDVFGHGVDGAVHIQIRSLCP